MYTPQLLLLQNGRKKSEMPRNKQEAPTISPELQGALREVRFVLSRQTDSLSDSVPEDICVDAATAEYSPETELFLVTALLQSAVVTEETFTQLAAEQDPWAEALELSAGFVDTEFTSYEKLVAAYKNRAEGCGCATCWREYLNLKEQYEDEMLIPYSEGESDAELIAAEIELYAPTLPEADIDSSLED